MAISLGPTWGLSLLQGGFPWTGAPRRFQARLSPLGQGEHLPVCVPSAWGLAIPLAREMEAKAALSPPPGLSRHRAGPPGNAGELTFEIACLSFVRGEAYGARSEMADVGFWEGLVRGLSGKGQFRLILQPAMALFLGLRLGIADAKEGKAPFLFRLFTTRHGRWTVFKQSLSDAAMPLILALIMDGILQYLTLNRVRPLQAVVVGALLVWLPFSIMRGLTNRVWKHAHPRKAARAS
ncbi:MAG: hypothetical protein ACJ8AT_16535 [Hyalangium sp.]|uniref:hypothetical protein n=1 Tax=Hyalangium sp. TaxID=2028555 RepID=UPI003899C0E0